MADRAAKTQAEVVEAFAAALRSLRDSAGNPSFREMSGRSQAISHTTLHEAAQGNRLPSWSTTVEFIKACGADPAAYLERWQQASQVVRSENAPVPPHASGETPPSDPATDDEAPVARGPRHRRPLRFMLPGAAVAVVAAVAVIAAVSGSDPPAKKQQPATSQTPGAPLSPADCPLHPSNPPAAQPVHAGDASAFIADITLPDCSHLHRGETATKVWRLKNVGKVPWKGYSLHRLGVAQQRTECQTISDIPIDDTAPGELVDIRTEVTAPKTPGFCVARFKMMDSSGRVVFPGARPVNFQLIVD